MVSVSFYHLCMICKHDVDRKKLRRQNSIHFDPVSNQSNLSTTYSLMTWELEGDNRKHNMSMLVLGTQEVD